MIQKNRKNYTIKLLYFQSFSPSFDHKFWDISFSRHEIKFGQTHFINFINYKELTETFSKRKIFSIMVLENS